MDETKRAKAFQLMTEGTRDRTTRGKGIARLAGGVCGGSLDTDDIGQTTLVQHRINTGDAIPVRLPPRRLPFHQRGEVKELLDKMITHGVIEPAHGPWASPIVLVKKKDGTKRFCVDFRRLNEVTQKDAQPLPRIDDTLDALSAARYFSTLDLASGYWQVEVSPIDREN